MDFKPLLFHTLGGGGESCRPRQMEWWLNPKAWNSMKVYKYCMKQVLRNCSSCFNRVNLASMESGRSFHPSMFSFHFNFLLILAKKFSFNISFFGIMPRYVRLSSTILKGEGIWLRFECLESDIYSLLDQLII